MDRRDADGVAGWIDAARVTVWNGAPAQLHDLARRPDAPLSSLREVWSGGSDTPDALRLEFARVHGLVPRATYGLTEAPTVVSIDPPGDEWRPGASGRVLPHLDVAAYDDAGRRLPPGERGELRVAAAPGSSWTPLLGYWQDGGVRAHTGGGIATGDIGTVDDDGWLTVVDRLKLVIVRGGANVYPLEVERVLATAPGVGRVAVCGVPDERLGQRVAALIESTDLDQEALATLCRQHLSAYKVPEIWVRVDALPVNPMGKVQRTALPGLLGARLTEGSNHHC
jgi:long-chain acyl-CoA synthetase